MLLRPEHVLEHLITAAGATAVCIVCYVIPVALHLKLYLSNSGYQLLEAAESPHLAEPLLQVSPCTGPPRMEYPPMQVNFP